MPVKVITAPQSVPVTSCKGAEASMGFLCHPSDFRFPQPMRIHPDEPFFNWAVPQGGTFSIEPGKPYVARYRFIVADGRLSLVLVYRRPLWLIRVRL